MNKKLVIGGILLVGTGLALFVVKGPYQFDIKKKTSVSPSQIVTKQKIHAKATTRPEKSHDIIPAVPKKSSPEEDEIAIDEETKAAIEEMPGVVALNEDLATPLATVNNVEVSLNDVIPPGILTPGEPMAESGYNAFLNMAIDRQLVAQKAQEMGIMDQEEFQAMKQNLRPEFESSDPQATREEIDWEVNYCATSAVVNEVYRKEGLMPRKITKEEVDEYYNDRSADYNMLRERERARGTSEDKIERKVRDQMKKDLRAPISREARDKQKAYLDSLREQSDIEYLK